MGWESIPQFAGRKKRNDLAPDDFTCGNTRDCTFCLVEIECRSLTLENSILRYLGADPRTTLYTLQRLICLARSETGIQFSSLISAIPTCDLEGKSDCFILQNFFGKISEDHHTMQSRHNQNDIE